MTLSTFKPYLTSKHLLQFLICLFIVAVPWQTRYLITETSSAYTTISLYGFDIVFLVLGLVWIWYWYKHTNLHPNWLLIVTGLAVVVLIGLSGYWAQDRAVALQAWLHCLEVVALIGIIASSQIDRRLILAMLTFDGVIQAVFVIWQTMSQQVMANKWLGMAEQLPQTSGVAVVVTNLGRWLRAYGTLPHPNIAGGFLVICLCATVILWSTISHHMTRAMLGAITALLSTALLLTFSRSAVIVWCICLVAFLIIKRRSYPVLIMSGVTLSLMGAIFWPLLVARTSTTQHVEQLSVSERESQLSDSWQLVQRYWPEGSAIGQYTLLTNTASDPEPVHNTPLLMIVELGVIITSICYLFVILVLYYGSHRFKRLKLDFVMIIAVLCLGQFDHYFWTLPSLFLVFGIILGGYLDQS